MNISEIRHRNFQYVIAKLEHMGITKRRDQGARLGGFLSASFVSQLLGGKYIGDDVARKICAALGQPSGWLDQPQWETDTRHHPLTDNDTEMDDHLAIQTCTVEGVAGLDKFPFDSTATIRSIHFEPLYSRSVLGCVHPPGRLKLITGRGDSMIPLIQPGETLIVDTAITSFTGDGLYLISTGKSQQVKGLQDRGHGIFVVSANTLYPPFPLEHGLIKGKVCLRNRLERLN